MVAGAILYGRLEVGENLYLPDATVEERQQTGPGVSKELVVQELCFERACVVG